MAGDRFYISMATLVVIVCFECVSGEWREGKGERRKRERGKERKRERKGSRLIDVTLYTLDVVFT